MTQQKVETHIGDAKIDEELKQDLQDNPELYVGTKMSLTRSVIKVFKKEDITPHELEEVGGLLAEKFINDVVNPINAIIIKFVEDNNLMPALECDVACGGTPKMLMLQDHLISMAYEHGSGR